MKELYKLLSIQVNYTTAYHPHTNRPTEHMNQEIEHYLCLFINYHQSDWHEWLPTAKFAHNDHIHLSTKTTPFMADMGHHPNKGTAPKLPLNNPSAQEFANNMKKVCKEVRSALKKANEDMTKYYNKKHTESYNFNVSDKVWLEGINITTNHPMKKLDDKHFGPFKIIKKVGHSSYQLNIPKMWKRIHDIFNEVLLMPYIALDFPNQPHNS